MKFCVKSLTSNGLHEIDNCAVNARVSSCTLIVFFQKALAGLTSAREAEARLSDQEDAGVGFKKEESPYQPERACQVPEASNNRKNLTM